MAPARAGAPGAASLEIEAEPVAGLTEVGRRYLDTRADGATTDGRHTASGRLGAGETYELPLAGRAGIDPDTKAVYANVIAVDPVDRGHLVAFDCADGVPPTSTVNYLAGERIANQALVGVAGGSLCIRTRSATHLVVDIIATSPTDLGAPQVRVADSRSGLGGLHRLEAHVPQALSVSGYVNLTAVGATHRGNIQIDACGDGPTRVTSRLNVVPGRAVANAAVIAESSLPWCVVSTTDVDLVVDRLGPYDARRGETWIERLFDSRRDGGAPIPARTPVVVVTDELVEEEGIVEDTRRTLFVNATVVSPAERGHLVVYACAGAGDPPPVGVSTLNHGAAATIAHLTLVPREPGDSVCVWSKTSTHLVLDVTAGPRTDHPLLLTVPGVCGDRDLIDGERHRWLPVTTTPADAADITARVRGDDGPFTVEADGPVDWTIDLVDVGDGGRDGEFTLTVAAPAGAPFGLSDVTLSVRDTRGRSAAVGLSVYHFDPERGDPLPAIPSC